MLLQRESKFYVESRRRQFGSALHQKQQIFLWIFWMVDAPAAPVQGFPPTTKDVFGYLLGYYPDQSFRILKDVVSKLRDV